MYAIKIKNLKTNQEHEMASSVNEDPDKIEASVAEAARWQMVNVNGLKPGEWKVLSYRRL